MGTVDLITASDIEARPELFGIVEEFTSEIAGWVVTEKTSLERFIGREYATLDNDGQKDFNNALLKLVVLNGLDIQGAERVGVFTLVAYLRVDDILGG